MGGKRKRGATKPASNGAQPNQKRRKTENPTTNGGDATPLDLEKTPFAEESNTENRKREARIYDLLGSADGDERIAAADALITALLAGSETVLERHLDKRLFRGLASSRNASRLGFSMVLTEILRQLFGSNNLNESKFPALTFDKVLGILIENTSAGGNLPGQEERDFYFGRLFGLQCFVGSEILFGDETRWPKVLDLLLQMANKKVWMRSHCGWVILESVPQMGQAGAEETLEKLADIGLGKTAEGVGIWLRARSCYTGMKAPTTPWEDPLSPGVLPEIARVLKENVAQDTGEDQASAKMKQKQSNWTAQVHFVWDIILETFLAQKKQAKDQFKLFWTAVIDDGLFSKTASDGQKFRGFMIFQKFLHGLAPNEKLVRELFARNFMKCLMNQAAIEDRYLHRAALKSLQSMEKVVEAFPELLIPVIKELIGKSGTYDFDQRTNTKTIENLLQWATPTNSKKVLKLLRGPVTAMDEASGDVEKFRQAYADYVFKLATQAKESPNDTDNADSKSALEVGVKELAACAYSIQRESTPELSDKTREVFRRRLASAFAKVTKQRENTEYLCSAVISVEPSAVSMSGELVDEQIAALKAMKKLLKPRKKSEASQAEASLSIALLYATTLLQLYDGAPDAISILQDLRGCSEKMKSKEDGLSELLVEILLALVSRQSPMMRQISEQVFEAFTPQVSSEALVLLTEPLVAEENSKGFQALFENLDEEDVEMDDDEGSASSGEEDDDEDEISEIGSDVEFVTLNEADGETEGDDDDNDDEDEDEDKNEQYEAEAQELANLEDALGKVLGSHRLDKDEDAESSDDDSDMSDSDMMELDSKLVEVFKQRAKSTNQKKDKKDAKESIVVFKHRVLDLLSIYVKKEASNPLAFNILLPLLELVRTTTVKALASKAITIIGDFSKASKKARSKDMKIDTEEQLRLLKETHQEASKGPSHAFAKAASTASLLVASSLYVADHANANSINDVYAQTFSDCQKGVIKMQGVFFTDWLNWGMGYANNVQAS
ncbi:Uu.00g042340.m01.CDS01 [Anthostomella pinea]|uniref:Uu.00g042340.m01.CDS01 n=1 Tax=Anthostomella pinea TaxID=933095 RepID=A0AAI8VAK6_9PEZI|nr:Uu.00g042340.m01.CDS01 [Anthostomella pinea]